MATILVNRASRKPDAARATDNRELAHAYADAGFEVFPCKERGPKGEIKTPRVKDWARAATSDHAKIEEWWDRWPNAVVGLPTGERNGLAVIDIDKGHGDGRDGLLALRDLALIPSDLSHVRAKTAGGGEHVYTRWQAGVTNAAKHLPHGIDIRGEGGYVIAPGSIMADGSAYAYSTRSTLTDDLIGLPAFPKALRAPNREERESANDNGEPPLPFSDLENIVYDLNYREWCDGGRDAYFTVIAAIHHATAGSKRGMRLAREWASQSPKYNEGHFLRDWHSFKADSENPITVASLIPHAPTYLAKDALADLDDYDADLEALIKEDKARAAPVKSRLTVQRPSEITDEEMRRPVIKGLIAEGDIGAIVGSPGVGKSLLAPYMAQAVAQGRSVFGMRVEQGGVLYVPAEDSFGMKQRTRALLKRNGAFEDFQLVSGVSDLLSKDSPDLKDLRRLVKESGCKLVIIDTLAMAFPGLEENSAEGMGRVVAVARSLTKWGAAVILIHHDTKDGQQGLPRGHSLLNGALDVAIHLKRSDDGIIRGKLTKNRNGSCERDIAFRIGVETLGTDEYGDPVEAAYCDELQALPGEHASRPLSNQTAEALRILKETAGHNDIVSMEAWEEACIASDRFCKPDAKGESRDKAFTRSRMALIESDRIRIKDGDVLILDRRVTATVADFDDDEPPSGNRRRNREIQELV